MARWMVLLAGLAVVAAGAAACSPGSRSSCLAWDRDRFGEPTGSRPVIDRLAPGDIPYDDLLREWEGDRCLRLNHVQVIGTHNSYHVAPLEALLEVMRQVPVLGGGLAAGMAYSHRPLVEQLEVLQVRQVELDVYADPGGGLFADPLGNLPQYGGTGAFPVPGMDAPGLKVLHLPDVDFRSTCPTFVSCLGEIRAWSRDHPGHLPILVLVEAKDAALALPLATPWPAVVPVPFDGEQLARIDAEIRLVFSPGDMLTPDDVRGRRDTLEEAVLRDGWPTLEETRGRVLFALDNTDQKRADYLAGHPSLRGRVMFVSAEPGTPEAAFVKMNDPLANRETIRDLVARGYLVRTLADADTVEARTGSTARRDAALASGAQFVSTDYPVADVARASAASYSVDVPGPGRCNPVLAPPGCDPRRLE